MPYKSNRSQSNEEIDHRTELLELCISLERRCWRASDSASPLSARYPPRTALLELAEATVPTNTRFSLLLIFSWKRRR
jgi:hypothetical protein